MEDGITRSEEDMLSRNDFQCNFFDVVRWHVLLYQAMPTVIFSKIMRYYCWTGLCAWLDSSYQEENGSSCPPPPITALQHLDPLFLGKMVSKIQFDAGVFR